VNAHFPIISSAVVEAAIGRFVELRMAMEREQGKIGKKVSTSELLDWVNILRRHPEDEVLAQLKGRLPFAEVLLKRWEDHLRYVKSTREGT
jgi:hypothetical protein